MVAVFRASRLGRLVASLTGTISARILAATVATSIVVFTLAVVIAYHQTGQAIRSEAYKALSTVGRAQARAAGLWLDSRRMLVEDANEDVLSLPPGQSPETAFQHQLLLNSFLGTYYADVRTGSFYNYPNIRALPPGYDPRKRPWFQQAMAARATILTAPYRDASLAEDVVTIATPLSRNGEIVGITAADFTIASLLKILESDKPAGSEIFMVDRAGTIMVHTRRELVGQPLQRLFDGNSPSLTARASELTAGGEPRLVSFARVPGLPHADWYVGVSIRKERAFAALRASVRRNIVSSAAVIFSVSLIVWLVVGRELLSPLKLISRAMTDLVAARETPLPAAMEQRADEVGEMARALAVFRAHRSQIEELTQAEVRRLAEQANARAQMMETLQSSFGQVVDAAISGNFDARVTERFADPEMNALARSIDRLVETMDEGLAETGRVLAAIARTDLTHRVAGEHAGAFAKLKADTNSVADRLSEVVGELHHTSRQLKSATAALLAEARELSKRTGEEANIVADASDAIRQLSATVADNARRAEIARERGREAARSATGGHELMVQARATMERMDASSSSIADLIEIIDAVASSTALLALNASIEAARAGDAGRGFAVVAQEMKSSAKRAAEAARKADELIERTRGELSTGSQMMADVTQSLQAMQAAVQDNAAELETIASANRQEKARIDDINSQIHRIEQFTQENAALVMQLTEAVGESGARAAELDRIVETFTVDARPAGLRRAA